MQPSLAFISEHEVTDTVNSFMQYFPKPAINVAIYFEHVYTVKNE